ncbi:MAG: choice-of-anchor K domain-containing protein [Calothrix sp. C42_A2020_038]|nr:choice-of-anchor K domain-containing protein [Calothrix sp. C42_A2020_038]
MQLSLVISKVLSTFAVSAVAALSFCSPVQAIVFSGNSRGIWGVPDPGSFNTDPYYGYYTDEDVSVFGWGLAIPDNPRFGTPPNSLSFRGTQFNSAFNSLFKIGDLMYFNGVVPLYTSVEQVPLKLEIAFQSPIKITESFEFNFDLVNVLNDPNKPLDSIDNADYVFISSSFANRSFTYDDKQYTLELIGFSQDGGLTSTTEFRVVEGAWENAEIYGRITYVPPAVIPEPGVLIGLSSLGVYMLALHKRRVNKV